MTTTPTLYEGPNPDASPEWRARSGPAASGDRPPGRPGRMRRAPARFWRGRPDDPAWVRKAVLALLGGTAALYLWNLTASGWGNSFYAAAVQAGTRSWEAFFYGSSDASNFITVDKPPASLWIMEVSARVFGVNSFAILAPQALEGVAAVGFLYAAVRRTSGYGAGLIAGAVLALTPVATLMFRYDNPDALLTLLMTIGAYCVVRALERAQERAGTCWLALAGVCIGFAFLAKTLQAFLVLPAFALVYLLTAPTALRRRIKQTLIAAAAMVAAGGWWVAVVQLVPAADRPYVGGSQDDSFLSLTFGYNGFGRLSGDESGSVGGGGGAAGGNWGATGLYRMFGSEVGAQVSWLLPSALVLLATGLWATRRARRADPERAALLLWGGWLLVTGAVFSYMAGIFHQYYTVALAPAIGALVGIGSAILWRRRADMKAASALAFALAVGAIWSAILLDRDSAYLPWLRYAVVIAGIGAAAMILAAADAAPRVAGWAAGIGLVAVLLGPAAYTLDTVDSAHTGAIPTAGPSSTAGFAGGGFAGGGPGGGSGIGGGRGFPGIGSGGTGGLGQAGAPPGGSGSTTPGSGIGGGIGGLLNSSSVGSQLAALLEKDAGKYAWVAAVTGSNNASGYQLATGDPVMSIGGFNGTDPSPGLAEFEQYVKEGRIHYYIAGSTGGGSNGDAGQIESWVEAHYKATTVDGVTLYDLSS
jgi:4-amino-4-deoxy-L-arabinose transferase-like glycosyltransferase